MRVALTAFTFLNDWDHPWYLANALDANHVTGKPISDIDRALRKFSQLMRAPANFTAVQSMLAGEPGRAGKLSGARGRVEIEASFLLRSRRWVLVQGPKRSHFIPPKPPVETEWVPFEDEDERGSNDEGLDMRPMAETEEPLGLDFLIELEAPMGLDFQIELQEPMGLEIHAGSSEPDEQDSERRGEHA